VPYTSKPALPNRTFSAPVTYRAKPSYSVRGQVRTQRTSSPRKIPPTGHENGPATSRLPAPRVRTIDRTKKLQRPIPYTYEGSYARS
jgi:hypothetical protein